MSELLRKQKQFCGMLGMLIKKAELLGFELTEGDGFRDPRVFGTWEDPLKTYSNPKSLHKLKLAHDFNIFHGDEYLNANTDKIEPLGKYWESIGGTWGGRFNDPGHFSLAYRGMK